MGCGDSMGGLSGGTGIGGFFSIVLVGLTLYSFVSSSVLLPETKSGTSEPSDVVGLSFGGDMLDV